MGMLMYKDSKMVSGTNSRVLKQTLAPMPGAEDANYLLYNFYEQKFGVVILIFVIFSITFEM